MSKKQILVCVDGSLYAKSACDYGIFIAKMLNLPLLLLNAVEHPHLPATINLAGNIGLGSQEQLLEELSSYEHEQSKTRIASGRKVLQELRAYAKEQGIEEVATLQRHGSLEETLQEFSLATKIAIIGLKGQDSEGENIDIGKHVETIIRTLNIPILLINSPFEPIKSILMAYDGSDFAKKAIEVATKEPIFPDVIRHIVNVHKEKNISLQLLNEVENIFNQAHMEIKTAHLKGDAVEAILEYKQKNNLDIIAMGAYSHNRLRSAIFGSFTSKMLLKSKKPLLLFR